MTADLLRHRVKSILANEWNLDPAQIPDDAALNQFEHWDSLGHIAVMLALRSEFGLELSPKSVQRLTSIPKVVEFLQGLEGHANPSPSPEAPGEGTRGNWDRSWEENIYSQGRHLNRYPHHTVVGFVFSNFGHVADRSQVRIVELGCGAGNNLWFAAREGFSVAGIDGSVSAIEYARGRFADEDLSGDFRLGDFATLPWPDAEFDVVLDRASLASTHREVIVEALRESHRILKPGGRLLSMMYSNLHGEKEYGRDLGDQTYTEFRDGYFKDLGMVHFATRAGIEQLFGTLFRIDSLTHTRDEDVLHAGRITNAQWIVRCTKVSA